MPPRQRRAHDHQSTADDPQRSVDQSRAQLRGGVALLWSYARPHLRTLIFGVLLGLFGTAVTLAAPMATKWVLDSLGASLDLAGPIALLVLLLIVGIIANLAQSLLLGRLAEQIVLDARRVLIRRFFLAKLEQIQRFRTGELVTRVTSDTLLLREATTTSLVQLINGAVSLVGTIVLMAILDWPLLLTTLIALVVVGALFGVLVPQIGKADKRAQDAIGDLGATLEGGMRALRTVKSSRAETREIERTPAGRRRDSPRVPVLALREVSAGYIDADSPALHRVTLEIPRTGHIALVGPSGAGKTTVFSLLLRFIDPTAGSVELDGVPYEQVSIDDVRSRIGYVEQETPIVPGTVRDNVLFRAPDDASDDEAWQALEAVRLDAKIRSLDGGLDANIADTSLSGGERQRLAVARALVRRPDVLLLDEATAQLDGLTEAAIQQVIADAARHGVVVTIAHRLSTVLDADQIVVLESGRVRDAGTHQQLLARDDLYREFIAALRIGTESGPA